MSDQPVAGAHGGPAGNAHLRPGDRPDGAVGITVGSMLQVRREALGLTILQAAEALRLDPAMIVAMEADRFAALGAPVYARGHLRNYAVELGLSPQQTIERYEALVEVAAASAPMAAGGLRRRKQAASQLPLWITLALLATGILWGAYGLYLERQGRGQDSASVEPSNKMADHAAAAAGPEPLVMGPAVMPVEPAPRLVAGGALQDSGAAAVRGAAPVEPADAAGGAGPAAGAVLHLRLAFTGTSWTEVYDAAGKQLVFGMGTANTVYEVAGAAPLRVVLGDAAVVSAQVDERALVIPRRAGRNTARFNIGLDGMPLTGEPSDDGVR